MEGKPRGRAALKEALLRSLRRPGEDQSESEPNVNVTPGPQPEVAPEVPKPRGRAALFAKLMTRLTTPGTTTTPQPTVTEISKAIENVQITSIEPAPITKLKKGVAGKTIAIQANYIKLKCDETKGYYRYEVKFSPDVDSKAARIKLIKAIVPNLGDVYIFNGMTDLYLPIQLNEPRNVFQQKHPFDPETTVEVVVIFKKLQPWGNQDSIHFINILFKRIMNKLQMVQINRNYFDFSLKKFIPSYHLEVIPGYAVAVDEMEGGLMICLDTCHKLLRKKSVLSMFLELQNCYPQDWKEKALDELLGHSVLTTYNNLNYIIDDILWDVHPTDTFESRSGPISYMDYYKHQHGVQITSLTQPLLLSMKKKKTGIAGQEETLRMCLIPELCNLTGISQDMNDFKFKKDMAEHTRLPPGKRFAVLKQYINNVRNNPEATKILKDWGLTIDDAVIDLNARVIGGDKILFNKTSIDVDTNQDWGRMISRDSLIAPIDMKSWLVLCPERNRTLAENFVVSLRKLANGFGCSINAPLIISVPKGTDLEYRNALEQHSNDNVQIFLIIVPTARDSLYRVIKNTTLARKGILGQVAKVQTLQNDRIIRGVTLKIALQMQAKLGGSLWAVAFPKVCNDFMFCGIDSFHSPGIKKSVGAIVCSTDSRHTQWYTGLAFQAHEIADALKLHFQEALEARKRMTGNYPSTVFMIRDGVGDGQLEHVKQYEMQQYLMAGAAIGASYKLCFIVVQKRNNTRIKNQMNNNPPPGTVIDHTITRKHYDDFYLVPQSPRQGTVTPMHYIILHNDDSILDQDRIQKLCFKLCHLYYNWTGAISVPAPCQYAHKAAYLVGEHMERKPLDCLNDKLYYL